VLDGIPDERGDASAGAGELDLARSFLAEAERIAGMWQGGLWTGAVWEARGILRQAEGDGDQARAMFREAAQAFARVGNQSDAARCLEAAAELREESARHEARHS
jgi:hypothetical protein